MNVAKLRYLPGLALTALAGLLYSRAGYGPFGDPAQRARPCEATRCAHNTSAILVAAVATLAGAARAEGDAQAVVAATRAPAARFRRLAPPAHAAP